MTALELDDLRTVFRGFGRVDAATLRPRKGTLEALLVLPSGTHDRGISPDSLRMDQLVYLLGEVDEDARWMRGQSADAAELFAIWRALPERVEADVPADLGEDSWLRHATARSLAGESLVRREGEDAVRERVAQRFAGYMVRALEQVVDGGEDTADEAKSDEGASSPLVDYSPLLLWGESTAFDALLARWVSPGWAPLAAIAGAIERGVGAPIEPASEGLVRAFIGDEGLRAPLAQVRVLNAALAMEGRRGRSIPRLVDPEVLRDEGAIWSWQDILALVAASERVALVQRLLATHDEWLDFDAPGEGELPLHLYRALRLSDGQERAEEILRPALGEDADEWLEARGEDGLSWLAAYPEPLDLWEGGTRTERGLLHEGIDEAFGDVFSPHDPFSVRGDD